MTKSMKPATLIGYFRVSTARQARSGLGLEAQREAVTRLAAERGGKIVREYVEIESGKLNTRPELAKALHHAKITGGTLVIAKLDRLSRNAAFLLTLRDSGARFIAADVPGANDLTVGILALVAQQEREAVSKRTREALAAAKVRGTRLGNPNGARALRKARKGNQAAIVAIKANADAHAAELRPVVEALKFEGVESHAAIAFALNERGILTPRDARWHKSSVRNLLARLAPSMVANRS
jgi:DNA invertase Pin-like site-specific DNA recombinase